MSAPALLAGLESFERSVMHWITCEWHHETLGRVFQVVQSEWIGVPLFLIGVALVARLDRCRALRTLLAGAMSFGLCMALATLLWNTIDRQRPPHHYERWLQTPAELQACATLPEAFPVRGHVSSRPSFPSRHALTIGSFAGALLLASRGLGVIAWCYGLFVVVGRVYVGKHWPTDLLAGLAMALVVVWLCWRVIPAVLAQFGLRHWVESPSGGDPEHARG